MWHDSSIDIVQLFTRWAKPTSVIWRQWESTISLSNGQFSPNSANAISPKFCSYIEQCKKRKSIPIKLKDFIRFIAYKFDQIIRYSWAYNNFTNSQDYKLFYSLKKVASTLCLNLYRSWVDLTIKISCSY
jgi:hypothetical protein